MMVISTLPLTLDEIVNFKAIITNENDIVEYFLHGIHRKHKHSIEGGSFW